MQRSRRNTRCFAPILIMAAIVASCGGGGGSGGSSNPGLPPVGPAVPLPSALQGNPSVVMNCVDGATYQCSGATILRTEPFGVALTSSGVNAYAISTSDLATPNLDPTTATGFRPVAGGTAELRLERAAGGNVSRIALLLSGLDVSWDNVVERPQIIEAFEPTQGITRLDNNGALSINNPLPPPSDLYYDYNVTTFAGTQSHYANNRYFPRDLTAEPLRGCPSTLTVAECSTETTGVTTVLGSFRTSGSEPDRANAHRGHSDGDVHAGSIGPGVPHAGNKGYRNIVNWGYLYSNIAAWVADESAPVDEWTKQSGGAPEHTLNRGGVVAFGATTDPGAVPTAGTAVYTGVVFGFYTPNGEAAGTQFEQIVFRANARMDADFATRQVAIRVTGAVIDGTNTAVPMSIAANAGFGAAGSNVTNYMVGTIDGGSNAFAGGVGGRFFGPAVQEIAGSFTLKNATTNAATVGGFIGRKQ